MKREIKFRGKRIDNGEWVYGYFVLIGEHYYPPSEDCYIVAMDGKKWVIPETVGQFTGLKDKNGKDLDWWEGEIFKMHGHSTPWVIVKEQGCFWFKCPITKERALCYRVAEYCNQPVKIGNIHEKPELLQEKPK